MAMQGLPWHAYVIRAFLLIVFYLLRPLRHSAIANEANARRACVELVLAALHAAWLGAHTNLSLGGALAPCRGGVSAHYPACAFFDAG